MSQDQRTADGPSSARSIDLTGVHYAHSDAVPLLVDLTLRLREGWTGVVGPNGAGKTTLLRVLAGDLAPDAGRIHRVPSGLRTHLCAQEVEQLEPEVEAFAQAWHRSAQRIRGRLALDPIELERWPTLSPGERKRWQVGAALADEPDALLLDEPTNHLDAEARARLLDALDRFEGIGLVVSHDRTMLERLTKHTLRFAHGRVSLHRGSYALARQGWEAAEAEELHSYEKLKAERKKERRRLADKRRARASAERSMSTRRHMKSIHDSDARLTYKAKRRRSAEVSLGRDVQLTRRRIDRLDDRIGGFQIEKTLGRSLFVDWVPAPVPHLATLTCKTLERGGRVLARDLRLSLDRESRVHLAGPNGTGKTTLLEALVADARIPTDRLLHLPQELGEAQSRALLEQARALDAETRGRLMNVVAALGVDPEALLASERPSPGEARKLALASGLARSVWALVLDEPTNHLDLPAVERLEEALDAYPGALLLVSHDATFAERVTSERWLLGDGDLRVGRHA